jgi:hypothetical protein
MLPAHCNSPIGLSGAGLTPTIINHSFNHDQRPRLFNGNRLRSRPRYIGVTGGVDDSFEVKGRAGWLLTAGGGSDAHLCI